DHRQQFFAEEDVRHTEHLRVGHLRMAHQELFDLEREEIFATANNHILEAAHDVDVALRVHGGQVAAIHPAIGVDDLSGLLWHLVVTGHDYEAAIAEFAALPDGDHLARRRINNPDIDMGQGFTHRRGFQLK